jgi:pimeloyl-ACP methyl ester carboxylesterase
MTAAGIDRWLAYELSVNGVTLHTIVVGEGPAVVLCHGFPELSFSWRHQIAALVGAGYRVIAPDMRGYGKSSRPRAIEAYDILTIGRDLVALLDAHGQDDAVFIGHDWGAAVVWQLAITHASRVRAVAGLSVPFAPRPPAPPISIFRRRLGDDFYMVWFQEPGPADAALARDPRRTLTTPEFWSAGWAAPTDENPAQPAWLTEAELSTYVEAFQRTGFTGGLNYYRNIDRNWTLTEPFEGQPVTQPAMFLTGSDDPVRRVMPAHDIESWATDLRAAIVLNGAGHWIQQERPREVNAHLLAFLTDIAR